MPELSKMSEDELITLLNKIHFYMRDRLQISGTVIAECLNECLGMDVAQKVWLKGMAADGMSETGLKRIKAYMLVGNFDAVDEVICEEFADGSEY